VTDPLGFRYAQLAYDGKLTDDPSKLSIWVQLKTREDTLRYYETLIIVAAIAGDKNYLNRLLEEYYNTLFPGAEKLKEQQMKDARRVLERFKDIVFVVENERGEKR